MAANSSSANPSNLTAPIAAGILGWLFVTIGFFGLKILMAERPQFAGTPVRFQTNELVQKSPSIVMRQASDDVSVVRELQPDLSEITFNMNGQRDYRGLKTIFAMQGDFEGKYVITNQFGESIFVLFKCPHPGTRHDSGVFASRLLLEASVEGITENTAEAWFWSGEIEAGQSAELVVTYQVSSLTGVRYEIENNSRSPINSHRVTVTLNDVPGVRFESSEGIEQPDSVEMVWQRNDFLPPDFFSARIVETRNLFTALVHLVEIGPIVSFLFLAVVTPVVVIRQSISALQILTIIAGYGIYYPLVVYLSAKLPFSWALVIASVVPGALLINYSRWLLGFKIGCFGGIIVLGLYQIFPTLAAFAGWNRGMVVLCLGILTLSVLIHLQNVAMKQRMATGAAILILAMVPGTGRAQEVQVVVPLELADVRLQDQTDASTIEFDAIKYSATYRTNFFEISARIPFDIVRVGKMGVPLFDEHLHLQNRELTDALRLVSRTNQLHLYPQSLGDGVMDLGYRVPIDSSGNRRSVSLPISLAAPGQLSLTLPFPDLVVQHGEIWSRTASDGTVRYEIGVLGRENLSLEWSRDGTAAESGGDVVDVNELYGIRITSSQHLTVINSDGSRTHFAEFELPSFHPDLFEVTLPVDARVISVALDGVELPSPRVENRVCRIPVHQSNTVRSAMRRLSMRLAFPRVRLLFMGDLEFELPEFNATIGTVSWAVAFPSGFRTQIISSGLELQAASPELEQFGDYGRVLKTQSHLSLAKSLVPPPGPIGLHLKYRQNIKGMSVQVD